MMDLRAVEIDLEIFGNEPRIQKAIDIGVRIKDETAAGEVFEVCLNCMRLQEVAFFELPMQRSLALCAEANLLKVKIHCAVGDRRLEDGCNGASKRFVLEMPFANVLIVVHTVFQRLSSSLPGRITTIF